MLNQESVFRDNCLFGKNLCSIVCGGFFFTVLQKCGHATEHVFIPSFLSMKLLHKIVEIYASIKGLHELQTKYCHNVCASFSPRTQGRIKVKGKSLFTILKVRRFHASLLFFKSLQHQKIIIKTGPGCMGM